MSSPDISAAGLVSLCAVFTGLSMVLTALRFYMRTRQKLPYLADDWLMLLSTVCWLRGCRKNFDARIYPRYDRF